VGRGDSQLTVNVRDFKGVSSDWEERRTGSCADQYMSHARVLIGSALKQGSSMLFRAWTPLAIVRDMEQGL